MKGVCSKELEELESFAKERDESDRVTNVIIEGEPGSNGVEKAIATIPPAITFDGRIAKFEHHDEFPDDVKTIVFSKSVDEPISRFKATAVEYRNIIYVDPSPGYNRRWADAVVKTTPEEIDSIYRVQINAYESDVYLRRMGDSE